MTLEPVEKFGFVAREVGPDDDLLYYEGFGLEEGDILAVIHGFLWGDMERGELLRVKAVPNDGVAHVERALAESEAAPIRTDDTLMLLGTVLPPDSRDWEPRG